MIKPRLRRISLALLDQAVSSGSNLLTVILVLRAGDALTFGAFSVAFAIHGLLLGLMRSTVGDIAILRIRRDPGQSAAIADAAVTLVGLAALILAPLIIVLGAVLPSPLHLFVIALGLLLPVIQLQDIQRYIAFGHGQPGTAVRLDVVWLLVQLAGTVPVLILRPDPLLVMYAWGLGAAFSAGYGLLSSGRQLRRRGLGALASSEARRARAFLADYALSTGTGQLAILGLSGILSLIGFGIFRLALTVVGAVTNVLGSARSVVFASIAAQSNRERRLLRVWGAATGSFGLLAMGFAIALVVLPSDWGVAVFGPSWLTVRPLLLLAGAAEALRVMTFPSSDYIRAHGSGRRLVLTRALTGISIAAGLLLGGLLGNVRGALLSLVCVQGFALVLWLVQAQRTWRSYGSDLSSHARHDRLIS